MKNYTIHKPYGYEKKPLKGLKQWVEALRGGEYKQGRDYLCRDNKFCCLGVKCKLEKLEATKFATRGVVSLGGGTSLFPVSSPSYRQLGGSGDFGSGCFVSVDRDKRPAHNLADCNDNGLTFPQIADIIEAFWYHED